GDVLTLALGDRVRVIELIALPERRGPPAYARSHYREVDDGNLDPKGQKPIAASLLTAVPQSDVPEDLV
ncbi:MAG: Ribosome-associated heat shock protein implicated in the recycling of the 50S subunit, partial [Porphyrobacter sp. HL-46]